MGEDVLERRAMSLEEFDALPEETPPSTSTAWR